MGYQEDLAAALKRQADLIKQQVLFEVISVVASCDNYDEFKKAMYGIAVNYLKEMESDGIIKQGTIDKALSETDDGILI